MSYLLNSEEEMWSKDLCSTNIHVIYNEHIGKGHNGDSKPWLFSWKYLFSENSN